MTMEPSNKHDRQIVLDIMQRQFQAGKMKKEECEELAELAKFHAAIEKLTMQDSSTPEEEQP